MKRCRINLLCVASIRSMGEGISTFRHVFEDAEIDSANSTYVCTFINTVDSMSLEIFRIAVSLEKLTSKHSSCQCYLSTSISYSPLLLAAMQESFKFSLSSLIFTQLSVVCRLSQSNRHNTFAGRCTRSHLLLTAAPVRNIGRTSNFCLRSTGLIALVCLVYYFHFHNDPHGHELHGSIQAMSFDAAILM